MGNRKYLNEEDEEVKSLSESSSSVSDTTADLKIEGEEEKKKERSEERNRRAKRLDFMKDLDTKISIELNQLLEKNSLISHKIQSHSSIGRTVNLRLISMLHRLKNRKFVIEAAYENLRRKEENGGEFGMGVFKKWGMGENKYFKM